MLNQIRDPEDRQYAADTPAVSPAVSRADPAIALNLALARLIAAQSVRFGTRGSRPGSVRAEAAIRRLVSETVATTTIDVLPVAAAELAPLLPRHAARLLTAHLRLVAGVADGRGWDLRMPATQTVVRLALAQVPVAEAIVLLGLDPLGDSAHLTSTSVAPAGSSRLWSVNRHSAYLLLRSYGGSTAEPSSLQLASAALSLLGPDR